MRNLAWLGGALGEPRDSDSSTTVPRARERGGLSLVFPVLGLAAVFWAQFAWVSSTNFWGFDEWFGLSLTARGIVDVPHANRPLALVWSLPAALFVRHSVGAFYVLHASYLLGCGFVVFALCRRLAPQHAVLAFLSGVFACIWAPMDSFRLCTMSCINYAGLAFGTYLALLLFVESWQRDSKLLLLLAVGAAFTAGRSSEAAVPVLAAAPVVLLAGARRPSSRAWLWLGAWTGLGLTLAVLILRPLLAQSAEVSYQLSVAGGFDLEPLGLLRRLRLEYVNHLMPLALMPAGQMWHRGVLIAVAVFGLAYGLSTVALRQHLPGAKTRLSLLVAACAGLAVAGLSYAPFVLGERTGGPARTQFLSTPGIAVFLSSIICWLGTWVRQPWRSLVAAGLATWVVAVATGRTLEMQSHWDLVTAYRRQTDTLRQLTDQAPGLEQGTLVVLIDERQVWPASLTFRHAVEYVYGGKATGHVWGAWDLLYPTSFEPDGVRCEPWAVIREAWDSPATLHGYHEVVVVRYAFDGLVVEERWPEILPPLPPGAGYDPWGRILTGGAAPPQRAILSRD